MSVGAAVVLITSSGVSNVGASSISETGCSEELLSAVPPWGAAAPVPVTPAASTISTSSMVFEPTIGLFSSVVISELTVCGPDAFSWSIESSVIPVDCSTLSLDRLGEFTDVDEAEVLLAPSSLSLEEAASDGSPDCSTVPGSTPKRTPTPSLSFLVTV